MTAPEIHNAHCVTAEDDVASVVRNIEPGEVLSINRGDEPIKVTAVTAIPAGHKIALRDFKRGENVIKYGEVIGAASEDIPKGAHVHVHNLEGLRGRGDKR
ncbi:MAG: UxaA family hydrolase [Synergistaceae bacterium]|jgi:altronate dehydratase small subunit|nr:UxaA family hydrolase [Synergistaceae bacterium]